MKDYGGHKTCEKRKGFITASVNVFSSTFRGKGLLYGTCTFNIGGIKMQPLERILSIVAMAKKTE